LDTPVKLIVGLGNPGPKYDRTRHNAGADFVMALASKFAVDLKADGKFFGAVGKFVIAGRDVRLLIPSTYMNRSGQAIAALANFYCLEPAEILVAHDELDLAPGVARLKIGGGHGGHNGLRDTIQSLANSRGFARLRIGIGHPGHASQVVDYVLRKAAPDEQLGIANAIERSVAIIPDLVAGKWNDAMKTLHTS